MKSNHILILSLICSLAINLEAVVPTITPLTSGTTVSGSLAATTVDSALSALDYFSVDIPLEAKSVSVTVTSKTCNLIYYASSRHAPCGNLWNVDTEYLCKNGFASAPFTTSVTTNFSPSDPTAYEVLWSVGTKWFISVGRADATQYGASCDYTIAVTITQCAVGQGAIVSGGATVCGSVFHQNVAAIGTDITVTRPNANYYFTLPPFVSNVYLYLESEEPVLLFGKHGAFASAEFTDCENIEPVLDPAIAMYVVDISCSVPKSGMFSVMTAVNSTFTGGLSIIYTACNTGQGGYNCTDPMVGSKSFDLMTPMGTGPFTMGKWPALISGVFNYHYMYGASGSDYNYLVSVTSTTAKPWGTVARVNGYPEDGEDVGYDFGNYISESPSSEWYITWHMFASSSYVYIGVDNNSTDGSSLSYNVNVVSLTDVGATTGVVVVPVTTGPPPVVTTGPITGAAVSTTGAQMSTTGTPQAGSTTGVASTTEQQAGTTGTHAQGSSSTTSSSGSSSTTGSRPKSTTGSDNASTTGTTPADPSNQENQDIITSGAVSSMGTIMISLILILISAVMMA